MQRIMQCPLMRRKNHATTTAISRNDPMQFR